MNVSSCYNFKLSKRVGVFGSCIYIYICGVNDYNEWKGEKRHECINMRKVRTTRMYVTSFPERDLMKFQAA